MTSLRRCLQRLSIIVLSLMAILAITIPGAQADDTTGTATITITKPDSLTTSWKDMRVTAYKVFNQIGTVAGEPDASDAGAYTVTDAFRNFFNLTDNNKKLFDGNGGTVSLSYDNESNYLTYSSNESQSVPTITVKKDTLDVNGEADLLSRITNDNEGTSNKNVATFYTWIEKYIEANKDNLLWQPTKETVDATAQSDTAQELVISDLEPGYYALIFSNVPSGISVKQGILIAAPGSMALKAEPITVTKQVSKDDGKTYHDTVSAAMNTILKYKITSKVPTVIDYDNLTNFTLTDSYTNQKLVQTGGKNFQLKVDKTTYILSNGTEFVNEDGTETIATLDTTTKTGTFTVVFNTTVLANHQGKDIELTYYAQLTADAINVNPNEVTLNYTNNGSTSTEKDSTEVYTYGIDVQKTFSSATKPYDKVRFTLYADVNGMQNEIGLIGSDGVYHVPAADETPTLPLAPLSLSGSGKLTVTGLDAGTYWLKETTVPDGYTAAKPIKITLQASSTEPEKLDADESNAYYNGDTSTTDLLTSVTEQDTTSISLGQFTVLNQKGFELPQTGAAGVWLCVAGGLVLIALGGVLFVTSRGRRNLRSDSRA